jgi:lysophospholipase L1-like esterase
MIKGFVLLLYRTLQGFRGYFVKLLVFMQLHKGDRIVFTGDSITDAGRREKKYKPYGWGYVHFAAYYLLATCPEMELEIFNTGISGNTIRDLRYRWQKDCIELAPDIVSILIGINDVWCSFKDYRLADAVDINEYEDTYRELLADVREKCNSKIVIMEPFLFCDDDKNEMFVFLTKYLSAVRKLAQEFDALLVNLQESINSALKKVAAERWSDDMVHPYVWAHCWISQRWIEAMGL